MALDTYRARCARGHDPLELTGQEALDHLEACLGRKVGTVCHAAANRWGQSYQMRVWHRHTVKPFRWTAPKPTAASRAELERAIRDGEIEFADLSAGAA